MSFLPAEHAKVLSSQANLDIALYKARLALLIKKGMPLKLP